MQLSSHLRQAPRPRVFAVSQQVVEARQVQDSPARPAVRAVAAQVVPGPLRPRRDQASYRDQACPFRARHGPPCHRLLCHDSFPRSFTVAYPSLRTACQVWGPSRPRRHPPARRRRKGRVLVLHPAGRRASLPECHLVAVLPSLRWSRCTIRQAGVSKAGDHRIGHPTRYDRPLIGFFAIRAS